MTVRTSLTALGLAAAMVPALPAFAAPVSMQIASIRAMSGDAITAVRLERKWRHRHAQALGPSDRDTVGSLARDGRGYAYNRFSGLRYYSCVTDEGYGRVRPCGHRR